jgi:hypothetical protein
MLGRLDQITKSFEDEFVQSVMEADKNIRQNEDLEEQASKVPGPD